MAKKGAGKETKLSFCVNALMESRHGLLVDIEVRKADGVAEREGALDVLKRQRRKRVKPKTLGADNGYHTHDFVMRLRKRGIVHRLH